MMNMCRNSCQFSQGIECMTVGWGWVDPVLSAPVIPQAARQPVQSESVRFIRASLFLHLLPRRGEETRPTAECHWYCLCNETTHIYWVDAAVEHREPSALVFYSAAPFPCHHFSLFPSSLIFPSHALLDCTCTEHLCKTRSWTAAVHHCFVCPSCTLHHREKPLVGLHTQKAAEESCSNQRGNPLCVSFFAAALLPEHIGVDFLLHLSFFLLRSVVLVSSLLTSLFFSVLLLFFESIRISLLFAE